MEPVSVAEIVPATVLECRAAPAALAGCKVPDGMVWITLRPDRALGVVVRDDPHDSARWERELQEANPGVLVVDVSPGWAALAVAPGSLASAGDIPARPSAPWAGAVAGVPAVVVPGEQEATVLVGASYARYLADQLDVRVVGVRPQVATEPDSAEALT
jgi:hypothetical protein